MTFDFPESVAREIVALSRWAEAHLSETGLSYPHARRLIDLWGGGEPGAQTRRVEFDEQVCRAIDHWRTTREVVEGERRELPTDLLSYRIGP